MMVPTNRIRFTWLRGAPQTMRHYVSGQNEASANGSEGGLNTR